MQIELKELEKCKYEVYYESDALKILDKRAEVLNAFKQAPVPGYRSGKASPEAIKFHYSKQIEDALKRALAEEAFHDTLFEKKITPHGGPQYKDITFVDGKFNCKFDVYTRPEVTLHQYKELEVPKPHSELTETILIEKMMQDLRVKFGEVLPYTEEDYVQTGDNVILNYESFYNGEKMPQLSAEGEMIKVGDTGIEFINENILGMKIGETREFTFEAPANSLPSLVGKVINFKTTLIMGSKTLPNPLDNSLAEKINMKTIEEVRQFVASAANGKLATHHRNQLIDAVSNKLVDLHQDLEVPNWMSLSEAQVLAKQSKLNWDTLEDMDKQKFISIAENNCRLALLLEAVRQAEPEAQLSDQELLNIIKTNMSKTKTGLTVEEGLKQLQQHGQLNVLMARVKDEFTIDFIVKNAKVVE